MPKLPPKEYLTLRETLQFMTDRGFSEEESKPALVDAFLSRRHYIEVLGRSKEWFGLGTEILKDIGPVAWNSAVPDWERNVLVRQGRTRGRYYEITEIGVSRIGLERWFRVAVSAEVPPPVSGNALAKEQGTSTKGRPKGSGGIDDSSTLSTVRQLISEGEERGKAINRVIGREGQGVNDRLDSTYKRILRKLNAGKEK
ncbi:hypothetical protein [Pelagibius sp. Alg239-R121]|uniref:hypothetical protein n=1 Tax=Pelagibius sp. Alg239-R121 TaxID=2993448 RepID=UPI0024A72D68|nr:hypothetical protein [Pelagibius sp. Alg239-R121]